MKINYNALVILMVTFPIALIWSLFNTYNICWLTITVCLSPLICLLFIFEKDKKSDFKNKHK